MMKKLMATLLAAALAFTTLAFVGCGGGSKERNDPSTLVVWIQSANQPQFFQWAKQTYESRHEGVTIKVDVKQQGSLGDNLDVTLGTDGAPDMTATWGGLVASKLVAGNKIMNLDDLVNEAVGDKMHKAAQYNKLDGNGKYYSIPLNGFVSPVIYYNKTYFTQNNIKVPSTYEELVTAANAIRSKGKQPLVAGFSTWHLPHFMQAVHARTMSPENFEKLIGTSDKTNNAFELPGYKEGWDYFEALNTDKVFCDNITGFDANTATTEFAVGNAVMLTAPSLDLLGLVEATTFDIGTFLLPAAPQKFLPAGLTTEDMKDVTLASGVYSDVFVIDAKTKKPDLAKDFAKFLLSVEAQSYLLKCEMLPVRTDVELDEANEILQPVIEAMGKGVSGFYQSFSATGLDLQLLDAGISLISGQATSTDAAQKIAKFYKENVMDA